MKANLQTRPLALLTNNGDAGAPLMSGAPANEERVATYIYWAFTATLLVFLSRIVWYDLRTIYAQRSQPFSLTPFFVLWTIGLLPAITWTWATIKKHEFLSVIVLLYILLIEHALISGLIYGHNLAYIAQEVVKYLFVPTGFLFASHLSQRYSPWTVVKLVVRSTCVLIAARAILFVMMTGGEYQLLWGTANEVLVFSALFSVILVDPASISTLIATPLLPIACGLTLFGQKRSLAVCFLVIGLCSAVGLVIERASLRRWLPLLLIGLVVSCGTLLLVNNGSLRKLAGDETTFAKRDQNRRWVEIDLVRQEFAQHPEKVFFGFGGGATLFLPTWLDTKSAPEVHSLHNTPVVLTYRHGFIGLFAYLVTLGYGVTQLLRMVSNDSTDVRLAGSTMLGYKLLALFASLTMFGVVDDMLLGIFAGISFRYGRNAP